ncbi:multidrug ABC transporter permease [Spirilliplanes yamanashiensis]|uniref:Multidrug ABC transporter permease n=1 Tax=Spirilliplanes yamanashiensis TaxID=42233 RepID=A0A8J4DKR1_9ACTN|nr:multidrug ABC transporter permease [Spirilliplanes yamanashiensis]
MWAELFAGFGERRAERVRLLRLVPRAGRGLVAGAVAVQVAAGVLPVGFIVATSAVVAGVLAAVAGGLSSAAWADLRGLLVLAAATFFGTQLLLPVQELLGDLVRRRIDDGVRDRLMAAAFSGPGVGALEDPDVLDHTADAVHRMRNEMWTPGAAAAGQVALVSRYLQTVLAAAVAAVAYAWWAGPALLVAALTIRFGYRLGLAAFTEVLRVTVRTRRRASYFRELLLHPSAAKELRVFGFLPWLQDRYTEASLEAARPIWRARRRLFHGPYVLYVLVAFVLLALVLVGTARATAAGLLGIGGFMLVVQAASAALRIGGFIAESDVQTEQGLNAYRAVQQVEALTAREPATGGADPAGLPVARLRFENVSFAYPGGRPVLDGLDLTIPAGRSLAVVGLNGAGKTTLVKLLARLYEPTSGRITADGTDIRDFDVRRWQRRVAAIFQDFVRFELPVRDNVGFGAAELLADAERGDAAVRAALAKVGATGFVDRLPRGLDTPLSPQYTGGADLSGGQWQRIAIARALMAVEGGAGVLVLDEPTANLDVRAEVAFFDRFLELTRGVTSLVISHRFSTVRRADRIVVLEHGRVAEDGTHDELLARGGRYAELFTLQAARFTGDE